MYFESEADAANFTTNISVGLIEVLYHPDS
jgi:hypothetical protein